MVYRFADAEGLRGWETSAERARWLARADDLVEAVDRWWRPGARSATLEHMFESVVGPVGGSARPMPAPTAAPRLTPATPRLSSQQLKAWVEGLARVDRAAGDVERIEQIAALERLKSAAAAAQAVLTADFAASQRAAQVVEGVPAARVGQGVAAQVALARRESPYRGSQHAGLARALVTELPATLAALRAGEISEWRATIVARETACLDPADRRSADAELGPQLAALGDRRTEAAARRVAYRLDPAAFVARTRGADTERRVSLRPAPDTMSRLTGFLPVTQGVAAFAALTREADRVRAEGDQRSRGQIMADTLVERVTGQSSAAAVPVEVVLLVPDSTLLGGDDEPAELLGAGPVPAPAARAMVRDAEAQVFLRRLFTRPPDGSLLAMESRRRLFPEALRRLLVIRDQVCRTPWCDAPVRHADHVIAATDGGATTAANGQGLCEACNHAKQAPGWRARPGPGGAGELVDTTTPTGHSYASRPPPLPGAGRGHRPERRPPPSLLEQRFQHLLAAA